MKKNNQISKGFTIIELLIVILIVGTLTTMVTINFSAQRQQQELRGSADDLLSDMRSVQSATLAGQQVVTGVSPDWYKITVQKDTSYYDLDYCDGPMGGESCTFVRRTNLPERIDIKRVLVGGVAKDGVVEIRFTSPYGKILIEDYQPNEVVEIELEHVLGNTRKILIDGISGRITQE